LRIGHACCAGEGDIEAGVIAHGSIITAEMVEAIKGPVLFLFCDNDQQIPTELRHKFEGILAQKANAESKFYPGMVRSCPPLGKTKQMKLYSCRE
jgi:dienelactone hydrolase